MTTVYQAPDVRNLRDEELPRVDFPRVQGNEFRAYFDPGVHKEIWEHAARDTSVEICGVLVGRLLVDDDGPYVMISASIRADAATSKFAEVTFTHESWSAINEEMDTKYADHSIVGWYHSHPDFGIFLSDRDVFIHENFFSGPGQVAHVVDPIRKIEGVFVWRAGKVSPVSHYWVGDQILVGPPKVTNDTDGRGSDEATALNSEADSRAAPRWSLEGSVVGPTMLGVLLLLLGYAFGGMKSEWDRQRVVQGTIAYYGLAKALRPGLGTELTALDRDWDQLGKEIGALAAQHAESVGEEARGAVVKRWRGIQAKLRLSRRGLQGAHRRYSLTSEEAKYVEQVMLNLLSGRIPSGLGSGGRKATSGDTTKQKPSEAGPRVDPSEQSQKLVQPDGSRRKVEEGDTR